MGTQTGEYEVFGLKGARALNGTPGGTWEEQMSGQRWAGVEHVKRGHGSPREGSPESAHIFWVPEWKNLCSRRRQFCLKLPACQMKVQTNLAVSAGVADLVDSGLRSISTACQSWGASLGARTLGSISLSTSGETVRAGPTLFDK